MTLWDHACCAGYGIQARASGLWHLVRGHRLHWRDNVDLWTGCTGDIWCEQCPDTSDGVSDLGIWCRHKRWLHWCASRVCGWLGHDELRHPTRSNDAGVQVEIVDQWYCYRCVGDVKKGQP
jgi:hypothetical protein